MAKILIKAGEPLWTPQGTHLLDENGIAVLAEEDTICEIDDSKAEMVIQIIEMTRRNKEEQEALLRLPEPINKEIDNEQILPTNIINTISNKQARIMFLRLNLLDEVNSIIENCEDIEKRNLLKIEWEYEVIFKKDSDLARFIFTALNMTEEQIDNFFIEASKI